MLFRRTHIHSYRVVGKDGEIRLLVEMEDSPESSSLPEMKKQLDRLKGITKELELVTIYQTKDYIKGEKIIDIDKASKTD